ncbi:heme ABC exporter ATP-binding protein CcmA [Ornithinimicrobium sp. F0845]|uniref:heme ABC exporter ATP-binding protein CcmA n=1 Tax=Ornithinimicrobium sp. F0845 TaxID=2926412 RepID=UPI001FF3C781|nr:heme ABC exporter ATP-binding protein CcmA [Ornithinimicrobium sp. F0845]MCK0113868.1 heme ABC exporter ATP-binding protein CcmA [Ornithinimicrobium sp. F0845]
MTSGPVVQVADLSVIRGGVEVLHGVDLTVEGGELVGIVGPSGGGKSTLMRAIVGVQANVAGTVRVLGEEAGSPSVRGRIGYVTQSPSIYDDLTARQNLQFFAAIQGVGRRQVEAALTTVDLAGAADQVVGAMSGGQQSRVSLATALLGDPSLLVLDEPTVGLDPVLRRSLWSTFRDLAAAGAAVLVSTHVMDEAERCDRIALLREGRVLATGSPAQLRERTGADTVEAAFLALIDEAAA